MTARTHYDQEHSQYSHTARSAVQGAATNYLGAAVPCRATDNCTTSLQQTKSTQHSYRLNNNYPQIKILPDPRPLIVNAFYYHTKESSMRKGS